MVRTSMHARTWDVKANYTGSKFLHIVVVVVVVVVSRIQRICCQSEKNSFTRWPIPLVVC